MHGLEFPLKFNFLFHFINTSPAAAVHSHLVLCTCPFTNSLTDLHLSPHFAMLFYFTTACFVLNVLGRMHIGITPSQHLLK